MSPTLKLRLPNPVIFAFESSVVPFILILVISLFNELFLYGLISTFIFVILLPFYYLVRVCNGKFLYGWKEKLGFFKNPNLGDKVIMYHGVSVEKIHEITMITPYFLEAIKNIIDMEEKPKTKKK